MDFSICFLAGGQMFPGTLAVPCAGDRGRETDDASGDESEDDACAIHGVFHEYVGSLRSAISAPAGTSRMTMPGVDAASPRPVPDPVGFCSST